MIRSVDLDRRAEWKLSDPIARLASNCSCRGRAAAVRRGLTGHGAERLRFGSCDQAFDRVGLLRDERLCAFDLKLASGQRREDAGLFCHGSPPLLDGRV